LNYCPKKVIPSAHGSQAGDFVYPQYPESRAFRISVAPGRVPPLFHARCGEVCILMKTGGAGFKRPVTGRWTSGCGLLTARGICNVLIKFLVCIMPWNLSCSRERLPLPSVYHCKSTRLPGREDPPLVERQGELLLQFGLDCVRRETEC